MGCSDHCMSSCPAGWEEEGQRCYFWSQEKTTWGQAEENCQKEGAHLASVTSQRVHDFLWRRKESQVWIGATDQKREKDWLWTDCSVWNFTRWGKNQPNNQGNEDCGHIYNPTVVYGWSDRKCEEMLRFVCAQDICQGGSAEVDVD